MLVGDHLSIYIHIPFCRTRCYYCDFNTYAGIGQFIPPYIDALNKEIERVSRTIDNESPVHTIFFGGGTPSVVPAEQIASVISRVRAFFEVVEDPEVSMEMNPFQLADDYLRTVKSGGVNRVSLGMQTASLDELRMLGRKHRFKDVSESVELVRAAGIDNINLDIIFGLPGQTIDSFKRTMEAALQIGVPHLSLYALTVEEGTPLAGMIDNGELQAPDADTAGDMYALAMERLAQAGYQQYEISNWAIDREHQCIHNLQYWKNYEYLGFGAGAHSHYGKWRWENTAKVTEYIKNVENPEKTGHFSPAASNQTELSRDDDLGETMMMGLRLTGEGINQNEFKDRFGESLEEVYPKEIISLTQSNLIEWAEMEDGRYLRLTPRGRMLGNQVFMRFLKD